MDVTTIALRPLPPGIGAEVLGVDTSREIDEATASALRDAWRAFGLLLFRDQQLDPDGQLRLARVFGSVSFQGENAAKGDGYGYISNVDKNGIAGVGELMLHMDHTFFPTPLHGLMLYAIDVPSRGGDTIFASNKLAYGLLPAALRERIDGLCGLHVMDYDIYKVKEHITRFREADTGPNAKKAVHPLVLTHPVTGEKQLYISRRHMDRVIDLPEAESEALLEELLAYVDRPDVAYRHEWRPGDAIVWDNFTLQHARTDFDAREKRHLRRIQIGA